MPARPRSNIEPFTVVVPASELPEKIVSRFLERPAADARFAVTIEPVESEAERLAALRRDLQAGIDDIEAGRVAEGTEVLARLKERFPGK